ncbi:MAG: restriction endonuclease subunit S [Bacteroidales bacterium]|nr:restriction endonuclease subunit S [Bacteroidales bacterium]
MDTKKLRQKILDLAIRGKLVPQDPNDEPASVLLERIRAEKERLIADGKIKRPRKSKTSASPSHYEKLPSGWEKTTLKDIAWFGGGKTPSTENKQFWKDGTVNWVTSKDMKEPIIYHSQIKLSEIGATQNILYPMGSLLMVTRSGILRRTLPLARLGEAATVNQDIKAICTPYSELNEYLYYYFSGREKEILEKFQKSGTTVESIDFEKFQEIEILLPPLQEQIRIIHQLKFLFKVQEKIDSETSELNRLITDTRSKVLELAMQGKLVPQDPTDEPAADMLRRVNPKAKIITDIPHSRNIPSNWVLCRFGDIASISRGASPRPIKSYITNDPNGVNWIKIGDTDGKYINSTKEKIIREGVNLSREVKKGDFLLTNSMSFGKPYILNIDGCIHDGWLVISPKEESYDKEFLYYLLSSQYAYSQFSDKAGGAVVSNLNSAKVANTSFPLLSILEQKRIVAKIEELYACLDKIETSLQS